MLTKTAPPPSTGTVPTDPYARGGELDAATADALMTRLEVRGAEPRQRALRQVVLSRIPRRAGCRVLEVGSGTGVVARELAALPGVTEVVGIDPCPRFVEYARRAVSADPAVAFDLADGRELPFGDRRFDVVVFATTLCHIPGPTAALQEAFRVLVPGGTLLVFDGDYATTTGALSPADPLQACVAAAVSRLVYDPWLVRRLHTLVADAGFVALDLESHGYVEIEAPTYIPTIIDFGAQALAEEGVIEAVAADALRDEARRRMAAGRFFGHIAYASLLATRPGESAGGDER
ncbi:MAG: methyltransferase domain-containing protein [Actinobacteria bacterium]|nr:methyltransferase domain-containing protein [Actinomycetota bacterium]